jgi:hypothetical protein
MSWVDWSHENNKLAMKETNPPYPQTWNKAKWNFAKQQAVHPTEGKLQKVYFLATKYFSRKQRHGDVGGFHCTRDEPPSSGAHGMYRLCVSQAARIEVMCAHLSWKRKNRTSLSLKHIFWMPG